MALPKHGPGIFSNAAAKKVGMAALAISLAFTPAAAHAQDAEAQNLRLAASTTPEAKLVNSGYNTETAKNSALGQAGQFADADTNNIGIIIYYGTGNEPTADQVGNWVVGKLHKRQEARLQQDPTFNPSTIDTAYFVQPLEGANAREGVVVGFLMGGQGIKKDIREAVTDKVLDDVLDGRATTARLLSAKVDNEQPMFAANN